MIMPRSFLWLSGWSVPASVWDEHISYWSEMGHGKVDFTSCKNKEELVPLVQEALSQLQEPVCVVAWSLGGMVALEVSNKFSRQIGSLCLVGVGTQFVRSDAYPYGWDQRILQRMKKQIEVNKSHVINQFDQNMFSPFKHDKKWQKVREETQPTPSLLAGLDYLIHFKVDPSMYLIDKPTFLLTGNLDQIISTEGAIHLHQSLPHSTLTIWKNAGHIPFWGQSHQFRQWIEESHAN